MTTPNPRTLLTGTTPGPWEAEPWSDAAPDADVIAPHSDEDGTRKGWTHIATDASTANARLIAAAPDLAARVIALEDGIRARHAKGKFIFSWHEGGWFEPACTECDGKAGVHPCGCYADYDASDWKCRECGPESTYPCPTIALLDEEAGE